MPILFGFGTNDKLCSRDAVEYKIVEFDFAKFVKELKKNPNFNPEGRYTLIKVHQKVRALDLIEFQYEDGTCIKKYVCVLDGNTAKYVVEVFSECDAELSYSLYERLYDYHLGEDLKLTVHKSVKRATNKGVIDERGYLKNGLTLDDEAVKPKTDTTVITYDLNKLSALKKISFNQ
ncbi:hypothetical protein ACLI1A_17990 [Flavobacterium sp. RHBU_3]|uniref:hypothetical protein n=1 Tax=Flavobacterium sp. RHBU_3 TaxID=3391184 RepID=UPI003984D3C1